MTNVLEDNYSKDILKSNQRVVKSRSVFPFRFFIAELLHREFSVHSSVEIIYILKGTIRLTTRGRSILLGEDSLYLINSDEVHELEPVTEDNLCLVLQTDIEFLYSRYELPKGYIFDSDLIQKNQDIQDIFLTLYLESFTKENDLNYSFKLLDLLMKELEDALVEDNIKDNDLTIIEEIIYDIAKKISKDTMQEDINLKVLSDEYNVSYAYLSRKFKEIVGMNITDYSRKIRLNRALDLLINTDKTISDIAGLSGFYDVKYMNRDFKKVFEESPTKVRQKYKEYHLDLKDKLFTENYLDKLEKRVKQYGKTFKDNDYFSVDINFENTYKSHLGELINFNNFGLCNYNDTYQDFKELKCEKIKVNIVYKSNRFFVVKKDGYLKELNSYNFGSNLDYLIENKIKPIFDIDFISDNYNEISYNSFEFFKNAFKNFQDMLDEISLLVGISAIKKWIMEFQVQGLKNMDYDSNRIFSYFIKNLVDLLKDKLGAADLKWGINFGCMRVDDIDLWFSNVEILHQKEYRPKFFVIDLDYIDEKMDLDKKGEVMKFKINKFINKTKKVLDVERPEELIINLTYILNNNFHMENLVSYYGILLNLVFLKLGDNRQFIELCRVDNISENSREIFDLSNNSDDIKLSSYYILRYIEELSGEIIDMGDSYVVTKKDEDLYIFFYGNFKDNYKAAMTQDIEEGINNVMDFNISGLKGKYKFSQYRINKANSSFYRRFIDKTNLTRLNIDEKSYIESMTNPELAIKIEDIEDVVDYKLYYNPLEIVYIKCQKI